LNFERYEKYEEPVDSDSKKSKKSKKSKNEKNSTLFNNKVSGIDSILKKEDTEKNLEEGDKKENNTETDFKNISEKGVDASDASDASDSADKKVENAEDFTRGTKLDENKEPTIKITKKSKKSKSKPDKGLDNLLNNGGIIVITQSFQPNDLDDDDDGSDSE